MVSVAVSKLGCMQPIFVKLGSKVNEKALGKTQTLRAGCSKTEPKIFAPPQIPFPGAQDG